MPRNQKYRNWIHILLKLVRAAFPEELSSVPTPTFGGSKLTVTPAAGDPTQHPFLFLWALCMVHELTQTQIKVKMNLKKYRKEMIEDSGKWDQVEEFIPQWSEVCKNSVKKLSKILRKGDICSQNGVVPLFQG